MNKYYIISDKVFKQVINAERRYCVTKSDNGLFVLVILGLGYLSYKVLQDNARLREDNKRMAEAVGYTRDN